MNSPTTGSQIDDLEQIDEPQLKRDVFREQVRIFVSRKRLLHMAGPFSAAYFAFVMSDYVAMPILVFWWTALAVADSLLVITCTVYLRKEVSHEHRRIWCQAQIFGLMISGSLWGLSVIWFYSEALQAQLYNVVVVVAVSAFSAVVLFPVRAAYLTFFVSTTLPAFLFYLWLGDFAHVNLAIGIVVMAVVTSIFETSATEHFINSLEKNFRSIALTKALSVSLEKNKELASRDYLTGLYNRRFGMESLRQELHRSQRYNENLSVAIMDIDHFKSINDRHGHLVGDSVLMEFSKRITQLLRNEDVFFRYGGEEFVVVFPHTSLDDAQQVAQRMRDTISDTEMIIVHKSIEVTVSMGVSEFKEADTVEYRLSQADEALYSAKQWGRNRVEIK
jgi:diguanylate cyclase (GGDEF)-like protein